MESNRKYLLSVMTRADWVLIVCSLMIALLGIYATFMWDGWFVEASSARYAVVRVNNSVVKTIRLDENKGELVSISLGSDNEAVLEVDDGRIRVSDASHLCPLGYCARAGWINRVGEIIVCVPNKMVISIEGGSGVQSEALDGVVF